MKFAPVSNAVALEYLPHTGYHLALSNQLLAHPRMLAFYARKVRQGDTVILDHPVHERLPIPTTNEILSLINAFNPTYVIVPDAIGDTFRTLRMFDKEAHLLSKPGTTPMGVVQGKNYNDYLRCIYELVKRTNAIGIPLIRKFQQIDRAEFVDELTRQGFFDRHPEVKIHLLGSDSTFRDVISLRAHRNVMGFDTAKPVYLAVQGFRIDEVNSYRRPPNYFKMAEPAGYANESLIQFNVRYVMRMVSADE